MPDSIAEVIRLRGAGEIEAADLMLSRLASSEGTPAPAPTPPPPPKLTLDELLLELLRAMVMNHGNPPSLTELFTQYEATLKTRTK